jgi:hypothetical protein
MVNRSAPATPSFATNACQPSARMSASVSPSLFMIMPPGQCRQRVERGNDSYSQLRPSPPRAAQHAVIRRDEKSSQPGFGAGDMKSV